MREKQAQTPESLKIVMGIKLCKKENLVYKQNILYDVFIKNCIMKKTMFILFTLFFSLYSCQDEIINQQEKQINPTLEHQKMQTALKVTSNILVEMIRNDKSYFEEINNIIVAGSSEYIEDRVMFKDLFKNQQYAGSSLRVKPDASKFTVDFKNTFTRNRPRKVNAIGGVNAEIFTNPDSLINFLVANDVILNCPIPLEEYDENNRIPAISFDPMNNDTVNIGYLLTESGEIKEVEVCQSYADKHPVWILIPNQAPRPNYQAPPSAPLKAPRKVKSDTEDGFVMTINKFLLSEYYCSVFCPTLNIRILRSGSGFSWNQQTNNYTGTFAQMQTFEMPRKYVYYAKTMQKGAWYPINLEWDYNWSSDLIEQGLSIYEHDSGNQVTLSTTIKAAIPKVGEVGVTISGTFSNKDDIITLQPLGRSYVKNVAENGHRDSNGNFDWTFTERVNYVFYTRDVVHTQIDGKYIYRISPSCMMTISVQ
jgi:hypothetical protein